MYLTAGMGKIIFLKIPLLLSAIQMVKLKNIAPDIFDVVPQAQQAHQVVFEDLDLDGDLDLIMSEAGLDVPPWTGGDIIMSINDTNGYKNITMPSELSGARAYAITAGDLDSDGVIELLISDSLPKSF